MKRFCAITLIWIVGALGHLAKGDLVWLQTGDVFTGRVEDYVGGFLHGVFNGNDRRTFSLGDVKSVTFSASTRAAVTVTNGQTRSVPMVSYEDGKFVFTTNPGETASLSKERIREIHFSSVTPSGASGLAATRTPSGNFQGGGYGASAYRASPSPTRTSTSGSTSSSRTTYSVKLVWVDGYRRSDGTWVEGHWREPSGYGTNTYHYGGGGSVYVRGHYRKDGTYVRGHMRRK